MSPLSFDVFDAHRRLARSAITDAKHAGLLLKGHNTQDAGNKREQILKKVIQHWFPSTYTMFRGSLVSSGDLELTRPIDLLVVDTAKWSPLVEIDGAVQILAEGVRAAIEVKSSIKQKNEFKNAIEKLSQASQQVKSAGSRHLALNWPPHYISCLFAYQGPQKPETIIHWLAEIADEWPTDFRIAKRPFLPSCIIVPEKYVLVADADWIASTERKITGFEFFDRKSEFSLLKLHEIIERRLELRTGAAIEHLIERAGGYPSNHKSCNWNCPPNFEQMR